MSKTKKPNPKTTMVVAETLVSVTLHLPVRDARRMTKADLCETVNAAISMAVYGDDIIVGDMPNGIEWVGRIEPKYGEIKPEDLVVEIADEGFFPDIPVKAVPS